MIVWVCEKNIWWYDCVYCLQTTKYKENKLWWCWCVMFTKGLLEIFNLIKETLLPKKFTHNDILRNIIIN